MFSKIIVPLDADRESELALPLAAALATSLDDGIILLSVIVEGRELNPVKSEFDAALAEMTQQRTAYAASYLEKVRARLGASVPQTATAVRVGSIAETILDTARIEGAGLIAMATHGRVGPERWFLGSVADKVVRTSPVPVLLVRPHDSVTPATPTELLVPLDGSREAEAALPVATSLAAALHLPITLIRTLPSDGWNMAIGMDPGAGGIFPELLTELENDARDYLKATADSVAKQGIDVRTRFALFRAPDVEVEDAAKTCAGPLVVMTSHGRSGFSRMLLGSVADRIVRSSSAPVIVVPGVHA